jgi:hypothetical protein
MAFLAVSFRLAPSGTLWGPLRRKVRFVSVGHLPSAAALRRAPFGMARSTRGGAASAMPEVRAVAVVPGGAPRSPMSTCTRPFSAAAPPPSA